MTKSKYKYLKRQLFKYRPYTSHGGFYGDWFDGDEFTIPDKTHTVDILLPKDRNEHSQTSFIFKLDENQ